MNSINKYVGQCFPNHLCVLPYSYLINGPPHESVNDQRINARIQRGRGHDPLKYYKASKPAFNVDHHRPASEMQFKWPFAGRLIMARLKCYLALMSTIFSAIQKQLFWIRARNAQQIKPVHPESFFRDRLPSSLLYKEYRHAFICRYVLFLFLFLNAINMSEAYGYVHANTHLRTHLDKTYGRFYPISEGFLKLRIQMCVESNSHVSNVPNKFQFW